MAPQTQHRQQNCPTRTTNKFYVGWTQEVNTPERVGFPGDFEGQFFNIRVLLDSAGCTKGRQKSSFAGYEFCPFLYSLYGSSNMTLNVFFKCKQFKYLNLTW